MTKRTPSLGTRVRARKHRGKPVPEVERRLRSLRARSAQTEGRRFLVATLEIRLAQDHWLGRFSAAHPEVTLEARHRAGLGRGTSVLDYWIQGVPFGRWTREIAASKDVRRVEPLAESGDGGIYRVVQRTNPIVPVYRRLALPVQFPLRIQAGKIRWELSAKRSSFEKVLEFLRGRKLDFKITSIRQGFSEGGSAELTPMQRTLLQEALSSGYFAVPRRVTLTELAERLGRSKSSVSESLAIIERKLIETALRPLPLPG